MKTNLKIFACTHLSCFMSATWLHSIYFGMVGSLDCLHLLSLAGASTVFWSWFYNTQLKTALMQQVNVLANMQQHGRNDAAKLCMLWQSSSSEYRYLPNSVAYMYNIHKRFNSWNVLIYIPCEWYLCEYATNFIVWNQKHIIYHFYSAKTCALKFLSDQCFTVWTVVFRLLDDHLIVVQKWVSSVWLLCVTLFRADQQSISCRMYLCNFVLFYRYLMVLQLREDLLKGR